MKRNIIMVILLTFCCSVFCSCSDITDNTLRVKCDTVMSLDPVKAKSKSDFMVLLHCMEGLFTIDESGTPIMAQAESFSCSDDGVEYTFVLRDDIFWSDGTPVTAMDYEFSWHRFMDNNIDAPYEYLFDVFEGYHVGYISVQATEEKVLKIRLSSPCSYIFSLLAHPCFLPVCREQVINARETQGQELMRFLSNGPYRVSKWEEGDYIELQKNRQYRLRDNLKTKRIQFVFGKTKNIDVILSPNPDVDASMEVLRSDGESLTFLLFHHNSEMLSQRKVREAIVGCLDRGDIASAAASEYGKAAYRMIPEDILTDASNTKNLSKNILSPAEVSFIMDQAYEDTNKTDLLYIYLENDTQKAVADTVCDQLCRVGFSVEKIGLPFSEYLKKLRDGEFDIAQCVYYFECNNIESIFTMWDRGNINNYSGWEGSSYHNLLKDFGKKTDNMLKNEMLLELEKKLLDDFITTPLYFSRTSIAIKNLDYTPYFKSGYPYFA